MTSVGTSLGALAAVRAGRPQVSWIVALCGQRECHREPDTEDREGGGTGAQKLCALLDPVRLHQGKPSEVVAAHECTTNGSVS